MRNPIQVARIYQGEWPVLNGLGGQQLPEWVASSKEDTMAPRISAVINTLNEEKNLPDALASAKSWVDEIIVVDMYSEDRTREIAESFGAKVYLHERLDFADPARAFALSKATGDWVLILDADERVLPGLAKALKQFTESDVADVVRIARTNYIFGHRMRATGWGRHQDLQLRFFRAGYLEATATIHDFLHPIPEARVCTAALDEDLSIIHLNYTSLAQWFQKMRRYTTIEADQRYARGEHYRLVWWRFAGNFVLVFWSRWWGLQGYKDGFYGVLLSLLYAHYDATWRIKLWRKRQAVDVSSSFPP